MGETMVRLVGPQCSPADLPDHRTERANGDDGPVPVERQFWTRVTVYSVYRPAAGAWQNLQPDIQSSSGPAVQGRPCLRPCYGPGSTMFTSYPLISQTTRIKPAARFDVRPAILSRDGRNADGTPVPKRKVHFSGPEKGPHF